MLVHKSSNQLLGRLNGSPPHSPKMKFLAALTVLGLPFLFACSSASKKTPELSKMLGKKVALVEMTGEDTAKQVVQVALQNQLAENGTFILLSAQDVETARVQFQQDPSDWIGIAKRAGADYALKARVLEFNSDVNSGYSREKVHDTQLEAETGEADTERLYKVKALTGSVKIEMQFANLADGNLRTGVAEKTGRSEADEREGAAHLPPRLSFLEHLSNEAFKDFFTQYQ
jgi:hypothetical protein